MYAAANDCYTGIPKSGVRRVASATIYFNKQELCLDITLVGDATIKVAMSKEQRRKFADAVAALPFIHSLDYMLETYPEYCI